MASLTLRGIEKKLGGNPILRGIDLEVTDGQLVVLVGPSGCGKSTLLRTIAGLELPDAGTVSIGEVDVTRRSPRERDIAMVFQSYALYPHLRVRDNLSFGLKLRGESPAVISERIAEVSKMLGLGELLERYPRELSGGQRQRVAMGRAIARRASLFLFDEPLSNLDAALRAEVRVEIKRLHQELQATMVYVTHDQVEAMTLADTLVILNRGVVEQSGPPLEVYHRPRTRFVAAFMGSPAMNFLEGRVENGRVRADGIELGVPDDVGSGDVVIGIRPHDCLPGDGSSRSLRREEAAEGHGYRDGEEAANMAAGTITLAVEVVEAMGFEAYAHGKVGGVPFVARLEGEHAARAKPGASLSLAVVPDAIHLFDPETDRALGR